MELTTNTIFTLDKYPLRSMVGIWKKTPENSDTRTTGTLIKKDQIFL